MDLAGHASLLEMTRIGEATFSAMDSTGSVSDKTPSPGTGSEFLVDEEAASTCPLLTPSPPAANFHISLAGSDHPANNSRGLILVQGVAYERQISPSSTDLELSSFPVASSGPDFGDLSDINLPPDNSCLEGLTVVFPGASATLESSSSSSSVLHEPTACAQLLNSHHYSHLSGGPEVAAFVCQENGGKAPLSPIQLAVSSSAKDYAFLNWNWPVIRRVSFFGAMSLIVATACAVIAIMANMNTNCKPPHAWWQGTLFYEVFPASFMDSNSDGLGDFPGLLKSVKYLESIGVRAVHLNSIFPSDHYPDHFNNAKNFISIDPSLGTLKDFQTVLRVLHKRNISVILDLPVHRKTISQQILNDPLLPVDDLLNNSSKDMSRKQVLRNIHDEAVGEAIDFWLQQGVDGFYLKGLEHLVLQEGFVDSIIKWRKIVEKFEDRLLMCSIAAVDTLHVEPNVRSMLLSRVELVDVILDLLGGNIAHDIKTQVDKLIRNSLFNRPSSPWIHWSMGSVETSRLASRLGPSNGSLAALLFNMMLPGTPSIFYGDEIGLQDYHNPEHPDVDHPRQLVPMHWSLSPGMGFTTSRVLPWISPSTSFSTISDGLQAAIGTMAQLRSDNPTIYMNGVWKEGEVLPSYDIRYSDGDVVLMERSYPRRHTYIVVSNLGATVQTRDLSHIYYGGTVMVDLLGRTGQYITFRSLTLYPGETIMLQLDN